MNAKQEFAVRLYRWALLESRKEMEAGFPFVSRLGNEHAESYLSVMDRVDASKRESLLTAFVKWFHSTAVKLLDEGMTEEEEALREWANDLRMEMYASDPPALRISNRRLEALLKSDLRARFGQQTTFKKMGPGMFLFESKHGPWLVATRFECGRHRDYHHYIYGAEKSNAPGLRLADLLSIESWMGIASTTDWTQGPANSEEEIAKTMVDATQRFLDAAPALLDGLSPDE